MSYNDKNDHGEDQYQDIYAILDSMNEPKQPSVRTNVKPRKKKKKKNGLKRAGVVLAVLVLLCGTVAAAALAGSIGKDQPTVASAPESEPVSEVILESSEESVEDTLSPTGEFKYDLNRFSTNVRKKLAKEITTKYVVLYDVTADTILFQKNAASKCFPASTTKMMTAAVASMILDKDDVITVGSELELVNEGSSAAGLISGMKLSFEMLMDALLLPSGNDAAYTIAVNAARKYTGDEKLSDKEAVSVFMELVNKSLTEIGCKKTHFTCPDGWHDDNHYTCAEDLARIAAFASSIPIVKNSYAKPHEIWEVLNEPVVPQSSAEDSAVSKPESSSESKPEDSSAASAENEQSVSSEASKPVQSTQVSEVSEESPVDGGYDQETYGRFLEWYNTNSLIVSMSGFYSPYADGIKTGFTDEAGSCVVASATMEGHTMIAVMMDGENAYKKYDDANLLFAEAFKLYKLNYTYDT